MQAKAFDTKLFKRILKYTKPYKFRYYGVIFFAIALSVFAALRPYLLKKTVDGYIRPMDKHGLFFYVTLMGIVLLFETLSQFYFVYWANCLGQDIIKDIRTKLFKHILTFRMKYFDNSPVGMLVTRSVSDIEQIARIFSQGLFMIFSDLLKMIVVLFFMFYMNLINLVPLSLYVTLGKNILMELLCYMDEWSKKP
jgi:ABC-type multidrug transport system fused ATPase/permease subunit